MIGSAVVGCGRMGVFTSESVRRHAPSCWLPLSHAEAIRQHPRTELLALCDVDGEALQRAAAALGIERTFDDPRRLLDVVRPRLLGVATRTIGRARLIGDAAAAGVAALHVEKPLCNSVAELQRLEALLARQDLFVTYGTIRRHFAIYRHARELAASGRYGPLREIRVQLGAGSLFWTHPHAVDLILFGAGERTIAGVQATLADVRTGGRAGEIETDPRVVAATVHFDDGVIGHITQALGADFVLSCRDAEVVVRADGAALETYGADAGEVYPTLRTATGPDPQGPGGTLGPIAQLVDCLEGRPEARRANAVVRRDMLAGQRILFAMVQSHLERSRIVAPDALDDALLVRAITRGRPA